MKNVVLKLTFLLSGAFLIVSFQNCSKVRPEILINDKMTSQGAVNTDEIAAPAEVPVDIGALPDDDGDADGDGDSNDNGNGNDSDNDNDNGTEVAENPGRSDERDDEESQEDDDISAEDISNCQDKKKGHHVVLDAQNSSYDGAQDKRGGGTTYISVKDGSVVQEIKNTQGKTVLCNCQARKISANVGSLILINSYADSLDNKRGNLRLQNSTINAITNMKGVIKK